MDVLRSVFPLKLQRVGLGVIRAIANRYKLLTLLLLLYIFLQPSVSNATCVTCALDVHVTLIGRSDSDNVAVELRDNFGTKTVQLAKVGVQTFEGLIDYSTMGFVFFVEWSCSYRPKSLIIHVGDASKKITLDWEQIEKTRRKGDVQYRADIFDVDILLDIEHMEREGNAGAAHEMGTPMK